jgi:RNA polymerase sigma-70 factor (ECF subfamily)
MVQGSRRATTVKQDESLDFEDVYAQHVRFVWRVLRGLGVPEAVVADAAQDVFMVVHRRLPEFDARHALKTWLFAIAYRVAFKYRRTLQRAREHAAFDDSVRDAAPGPDATAEGRDAERLMAELFDELDERKRAVMVLSEWEELTAPEISAITGIRLSSVYTLLRRARIQLNRAFVVRQKRQP